MCACASGEGWWVGVGWPKPVWDDDAIHLKKLLRRCSPPKKRKYSEPPLAHIYIIQDKAPLSFFLLRQRVSQLQPPQVVVASMSFTLYYSWSATHPPTATSTDQQTYIHTITLSPSGLLAPYINIHLHIYIHSTATAASQPATAYTYKYACPTEQS